MCSSTSGSSRLANRSLVSSPRERYASGRRLLAACVQCDCPSWSRARRGRARRRCCLLAAELDASLRVVVAEEVFEADVRLPNVAHMQIDRRRRPQRSRLRPSSPASCAWRPTWIVGEVRDAKASVAPHGCHRSAGLTTISGSAGKRSPFGSFAAERNGHVTAMRRSNSLVNESIDIVVHCARADSACW